MEENVIEISVGGALGKGLSAESVGGALDTAQSLLKSERGRLLSCVPIHLSLAAGIYHEIIAYNLANPLIIEAEAGVKREDCVISAENCELFHKDTENRAVFVIGKEATSVTLRGFTIENTHIKTLDNARLGNQAEALCFHNLKGRLFCEDMRFVSRQDTIHVKGVSCFKNCYITGDVDYVWGYCDLALFEDCRFHTRQDNRGSDKTGFVFQSRALNGKPGFVALNCLFTAEKRSGQAAVFVARSAGTGSEQSEDRWDSVALINCVADENYDDALWTDEEGRRKVFPQKGSAFTGWREFGTKKLRADGSVCECAAEDYKKREKHGTVLTEDEARSLLRLLKTDYGM